MSEHLTCLAKKLASECTDRRMRTVCIFIFNYKKKENLIIILEFTSN